MANVLLMPIILPTLVVRLILLSSPLLELVTGTPIQTSDKTLLLEKFFIELKHEDMHPSTFEAFPLVTTVEKSWIKFPNKDSIDAIDAHHVQCEVALNVVIPLHGSSIKQNYADRLVPMELCLYKENSNQTVKEIFDNEALMQILGASFSPGQLVQVTQPVIGYVFGKLNSHVIGHIIEKYFYGMVRIYDKKHGFHRHYYIEPIENGKLYSKQFACRNLKSENKDANAIIFEYVPHEDTNEVGNCAGETESRNEGNRNDSIKNSAVRSRRKANPSVNDDSNGDIVGAVKMNRRNEIKICPLCIWVQPNFAQKFSLGGNLQVGLTQLVNILTFTNKIFRSIDFNDDGIAEDVGFHIKNLIVDDGIKFMKEETNSDTTSTADKMSFSKEIHNLDLQKSMDLVNIYMNKTFLSIEDCCIKLGFIYQNMAPFLSIANKRGACSKNHSLALISGYLHSHKVGLMDIYRAVIHAIGHLLGAGHDDGQQFSSQNDCGLPTTRIPTEFINPQIMHPAQQLNVGLRPGSMSFSKCSKNSMARFLMSNGADCFLHMPKGEDSSFCGNGIIEVGEECDCGTTQCHTIIRHHRNHRVECCGESDTLFGCKIIKANIHRQQCLN